MFNALTNLFSSPRPIIDTVIALMLISMIFLRPSPVFSLSNSMLGRAAILGSFLAIWVYPRANFILKVAVLCLSMSILTTFREGMDHEGEGEGEEQVESDQQVEGDGEDDGDEEGEGDGEEEEAGTDTEEEEESAPAPPPAQPSRPTPEQEESTPMPPAPPSVPAQPANEASPPPQAQVDARPPAGIDSAASFRKRFCNRDNILIKGESAVCLSNVSSQFPYIEFTESACDPCKATCLFTIRDRLSGEEQLRPSRSSATSDDPVAVQMNQ